MPNSDENRPLYFPLTTILLILVVLIFKWEFAMEMLGALSYMVGMSQKQTVFLVIFGLVFIAIVANGVLSLINYLIKSKEEREEKKKQQEDVHAMERQALIDIFNASNGKKWTDKTRWCSDEPVHRWKGVHIDSRSKRVEKIILAGNNLTGTLSPSIGKFEYLNELDLRQNNIAGEIPELLTHCCMIEGLYINDNNFTGKIPRDLLYLPYIKGLYAYNNLIDDGEKASANRELEIAVEKRKKEGSNYIIHLIVNPLTNGTCNF
jgi:hypothetical protein